MTTQTLHSSAFQIRGIAQILGFFTALAKAFALASNAQARFDEIQHLQALTDGDLAQRGIKRDDIVRHVYSDLMGAA